MSDYPDPDEEYELMYADEYELLREAEENEEPTTSRKKVNQAKRSLDFSSPAPKKTLEKQPTSNNAEAIVTEDIPLTPSLQPMEDVVTTTVNTNKRTADELFGDIADIDFDNVGLPSKRQKTEEETDLELIDKILEGRRLRQILAEPERGLVRRVGYDVKENISLDIPRWAFIPLTNSNGERMYVKFDSEEDWDSSINLESVEHTFNNQALYEEAKTILEKKQEERDRASIATQASQPLLNMEEDFGSTLWVDKYRPESYLDLLTEEPVNRALLHWLHLWDKIVFKKEVKVKEPQQRNSFQKRTGQFQMVSKWKGKKEAQPEVDEDGRPHHKVALLCGPPGVGKTTLAHLLARLTGYRPVELNASDERSVEAFRKALQSATLMQSVLDAERRPNCLILDEIDGAPLPTVELLVKWCTASKTEGNKKKAKVQPLKRPVIAICNDLYATALRPLRAIAQIIHVSGISSVRLTGRLSWAAQSERLRAHPRAIAELAKRARGDVRAALHALSFIKARAKQQLTMEDVLNANIGDKDANTNVLQALQAVFAKRDVPEPVADCTKVVAACGEYERVIDGIFENYLKARVDSRLVLACSTLSWLRTFDEINSWTQRRQNYALYGMLPLCAAACYLPLAARTVPHLMYPMVGQEMYRKGQELESIVSSVASGSGPSVRLGWRTLRLDLLPLLPYLLSPQLRAANVQLCSENELKSLRAAAGAMCDYGLQYVQQRTPDGLYAFVLEPDIYKVAFFGSEDRARPPPQIRQAIAREQQLEEIRRTEAMTTRLSQSRPVTARAKQADGGRPANLPNHLQRLQPKAVVPKAPQVHKDFFGRVVPTIECSQIRLPDGSRDVIASSSVFYQYREGFNNAVRRSVRMRDLL